MILTCPNCGTQYVVKDGAIPPQGRQVRCASCKHSWHQDPEPTSAAQAPEPEVAAPDEDETIAEATMIAPRSGPEAEERAYEGAVIEEAEEQAPAAATESPPAQPHNEAQERDAAELAAEHRVEAMSSELTTAGTAGTVPLAAADWSEPPQAEATDDEFSPFPAPDAMQPRPRNPFVTILVIVLVVAALAAALYFLSSPDFKARLGIGSGAASQLALIVTHRERHQLESGNELLTVSGRVINPTGEVQEVPPLHAQLKSATGKTLYSWTIAPPAPTLAPGESKSFNSAEVNVPPGGDGLTIFVGEPKA